MRALLRTVSPTEHQIQCALVEWAQIMVPVHPELALLYAIPNGGLRSKAAAGKLRAEGVRPGVLDMHLPVARKGFHGLWIEHKSAKGTLSGPQGYWLANLRLEGHLCVLSRSFEQSRDALLEYLK